MASGKWAMLKINCMLKLSHKNLDVYKISLNLLEEVYKITRHYPKEELYVLVSQIRRVAISVCSNIAEGASRISRTEKKRFYEISRSSLVELDTQIEISLILKYNQPDQIKELEQYLESAFRMLSKMIDNIRQNPTSH